jgi:citrate lyase subunit beta/citryl-CoA lyase
MKTTNLPVTYLFVPGNRPERYDKALASGADAIIIDLEDAVSPPDKDRARTEARQWIGSHPEARERVVVRINDVTTAWFPADIAFVASADVMYVMLPKAESAQQVDAVARALSPEGRVLPLIETARGVNQVAAIAAAKTVQRLAFGTLDYAVDLDLSGDERGLMFPAARIAIESRCAGIASPIGGVTPAIDDDARLRADLAFDRAFGFGAKLCIHPRQVGVIRDALRPTDLEIAWATRVIAAIRESQGAVQVDGRMVDRPVLLKAQAVLDRASMPDPGIPR